MPDVVPGSAAAPGSAAGPTVDPRIAGARAIPASRVLALIDAHALHPWIGIVGEPRVNVLALNLALDGKAPRPAR